MANPAVEVSQYLGRLAKAKIAPPPSEVLTQGGDDLSQASALVAPRQLFDPSFEPRQCLRSNLTPIGRVTSREAKPQETSVLRSVHGTLALIHFQLEADGDEPTDTGHHPVTGPPAPHVDIMIIGVAAESVPSGLKFLVQFVQHDIGKER